MKLTISHLRQIIQEELKEGLAGATAAHMNTYPEDKKQAQIRNKADEMVDFGKWEKQVDKVTDDFEAAMLALEKPLLARDQAGIAQARANIKKARLAFRGTIKQTSEKLFMYFMTVKKLGGTLEPDEEQMMNSAYTTLQKKQQQQNALNAMDTAHRIRMDGPAAAAKGASK
tara:strand:+ start:169 stop:681 length:513 start_codon:yes stop_codon:yes gene_type:complete